MGHLRKINFRNFSDVSTQMQIFDQRISKIEGVHGNFQPNAKIDSQNKSTVKNITAPVSANDAARYTDSMRFKTYSFFMGGAATGTTNQLLRLAGGVAGVVYWWGAGYNQCHTAPCDLEFYRLSLYGVQHISPASGNVMALGTIYGTGGITAPSARVASVSLWSRGTPPLPSGVGWGTSTIRPINRTMIPRGASLYFSISLMPAIVAPMPWVSMNLIADFRAVDR